MKNSNKLIILSAFVFLVSLSLLLSAIFKDSPENSENREPSGSFNSMAEEKTLEAENNVSEPISKKENKSEYLIKIHENKICAYIVTENGTSLWNAVSIPHGLTDDERKLLEDGIHTDSFEEMCLYLEAYVS